ncbi:alpha-1,2-fucosyltransferase [Microbacterium sp. 22242]|uniref:alpha-1,2-fucosyltransferase n=1 Tax=Microbacterium sp. 22242 TaxID=3453896 RepID=UPI003F83BE1C
MSPIRNLAVAVRARTLVPLGRILGAPRVQLTSPLTGAGNHLYDWMWAYRNDAPSAPARVLRQPGMAEWLQEFPLLEDLTVEKSDVPRLLTDFIGTHQDMFGRDFARADVDRFCQALLASSPAFRTRIDRAAAVLQPGSVVVNVRRGDYYRHDFLQEAYGLDIAGYVQAAVRRLRDREHPLDDIVLVSDDVEWCLRELPAVLPSTPRVVEGRRSPLDDLAVLAASRTTVLANSTFSFWGAHLAAARDPEVLVLAPPYHFIDDGVPSRERFDPAWLVVES